LHSTALLPRNVYISILAYQRGIHMARKEIELKVVASSLAGSGDAKMCREHFEYFCIKDGEEIEILNGKYTLLLNAHEDPIYDASSIRIRSEDLYLLGAREGDPVKVILPRPPEPVKVREKPQPAPKKAKKTRKKKTKK